jgi:hypothetical protein
MKEDEMGGTYSAHGEMRNTYKSWLKSLNERYNSKDLGVDGRILTHITGKLVWRVWIGFIWHRIRTGCGFL